MTTKETLLALRELLSDEKRWTKKVLAREPSGFTTSPISPKASCFCMGGGLMKILRCTGGFSEPYQNARDAIVRAAGAPIATANDRATHAEMLAILDEAIRAES